MFFKNSKGRNVIRVSDTTDHGGEVITGADNWTVDGRPVARVGDLVRCPQCLGQTYPIVEGDEMISAEGRRIAFDGHLTACGARLISSLGKTASTFANSVSGAAGAAGGSLSGSGHRNDNTLTDGKSNEDRLPSDLLREDETKIIISFRRSINYMNANGIRRPGSGRGSAYLNNLQSDEEWTGNVINALGGNANYLECYGQTMIVLKHLHELDLNYKWVFNLAEKPGHYWAEAVAPIGSKVIVLDALYDEVRITDSPWGNTLLYSLDPLEGTELTKEFIEQSRERVLNRESENKN